MPRAIFQKGETFQNGEHFIGSVKTQGRLRKQATVL
jgi:hypothetical protein